MKINILCIIILFLFVAEQNYTQSQLQKISDLSLAPVSTFKNHCARCHGDEGISYGEHFGELPDPQLKAAVEDMMFGPAELSTENIEIDAMTAYNKSLKDRKPFAAVVNSFSFINGKEKYLLLDVSPDARLETDNKNVKIENDGNSWKLFFDYNKINSVKISVIRNEKSSSLIFPKETWTR